MMPHFPWNAAVWQKKKDVLTTSSGYAPEWSIKKAVEILLRQSQLHRCKRNNHIHLWKYGTVHVPLGIQRNSKEWLNTYKIRAIVERAINHFKINMCIAGSKTRNHITTKSDVFLASIANQLPSLLLMPWIVHNTSEV